MSEKASNKDVWSVALRFADLATKAIVIAVPVLYFVGWAYAEGFWKVYGISDEIMAYTTQELMRIGGIVLLENSLHVVAAVVVCSSVVIAAAFVLEVVKDFLVGKWSSWKEKRKRDKDAERPGAPKKRPASQQVTNVLQVATGTATKLFALSVAYVILLAAAIHPAIERADTEAREGVLLFQNHLTVDQRFTLAYMSAKPDQPRILIRCSNAACALYTGTGIEVVAKDAVERMLPCAKVEQENGVLVCRVQFKGLLPAKSA